MESVSNAAPALQVDIGIPLTGRFFLPETANIFGKVPKQSEHEMRRSTSRTRAFAALALSAGPPACCAGKTTGTGSTTDLSTLHVGIRTGHNGCFQPVNNSAYAKVATEVWFRQDRLRRLVRREFPAEERRRAGRLKTDATAYQQFDLP